MFIVALIEIAKKWEKPKCPSTEWINKMWYMHTMEYYAATGRMKHYNMDEL